MINRMRTPERTNVPSQASRSVLGDTKGMLMGRHCALIMLKHTMLFSCEYVYPDAIGIGLADFTFNDQYVRQ